MKLLRRELTPGERHMAVFEIDDKLNRAKDRLHERAERAKRSSLRQWARNHRLSFRIRRRDEMRSVLGQLYLEGQRHAEAELRSMGVKVRRRRFLGRFGDPRLAQVQATFEELLNAHQRKVAEHVAAERLKGRTHKQAMKSAERVLGTRDAASRVVSSAFNAGLAETFERHVDRLPQGWQYSAILDGGVCPTCAALDGTEYPTWAAISQVLPNGGPNPACHGDGRCRCRPVPIPPEPERAAA